MDVQLLVTFETNGALSQDAGKKFWEFARQFHREGSGAYQLEAVLYNQTSAFDALVGLGQVIRKIVQGDGNEARIIHFIGRVM